MSERFRDPRIHTSLAPHVGRSATGEEVVRDMAATVYHQDRGVMFFREDIDRMPWAARDLIEAEARRLYGQKRNRR